MRLESIAEYFAFHVSGATVCSVISASAAQMIFQNAGSIGIRLQIFVSICGGHQLGYPQFQWVRIFMHFPFKQWPYLGLIFPKNLAITGGSGIFIYSFNQSQVAELWKPRGKTTASQAQAIHHRVDAGKP